MDDFRFNHIGQSTANQAFSFPRKRTPAGTPSLLSRMSGRDDGLVEEGHANLNRSRSPKLARPQRNVHASLSDRIQPPLPLSNRLSTVDQAPVRLVGRISAQEPAVPTVAPSSRMPRLASPASAGTIKPFESPPAPPVSTRTAAVASLTPPPSRPELTPLQNLAVVAASRSTVPVPLPPARTAPLSTPNRSTVFDGTTDSEAVPHSLSSIQVDSLIPSSVATTTTARILPTTSTSPALSTDPAPTVAPEPCIAATLSMLNLSPNSQTCPSFTAAAPCIETHTPAPVRRPTSPPFAPLFVSPSKTGTPAASSTKEGTSSTPMTPTSGTLALYLAPLWAESEAQMREWAQVANERAQDQHHLVQPHEEQSGNGGKKREREGQPAGENVLPRPPSKRVKVSTGEGRPQEQVGTQKGPIAAGSSSCLVPVPALSCSSSTVSISQPRPESTTGCANADAELPPTPKQDAPATVEVKDREQRERDEAAEIRKMHLEQELAFVQRAEEERIRKAEAEKHQLMKEQEQKARAERELKEQRDRADRELQDRERMLRDEVQKRRMEKAAQGQAKVSSVTSTRTVLPPPSVLPALDPGGPNAPTIPAIIVPIHNQVPAPKVNHTPSLERSVRNLQHPLPPRLLPCSGGVALGPSKPSASVVHTPLKSANQAQVNTDKDARVGSAGSSLAAPASKPQNTSAEDATLATAEPPVSGAAGPLPSTSGASGTAPVAPLLPHHTTAPGSVPPAPHCTASSQQTPSTLIHPMAVKQEAVEPQLNPFISCLANTSAFVAHAQAASTKPAVSPTAPHPAHPDPTHVDPPPPHAFSTSQTGTPHLEQKSRAVLMPSANAAPPISKAKPEPKLEPESEAPSDLSLEMLAQSPSLIVSTNHPSGKRARSVSNAETSDHVVKKRRDTSLESTMELTYPDATPETSGWGHVDLDQEEERRPGGRHRRPRTCTPEDASPAADDVVVSRPDLARTPPRLPGPPPRSRSRSPVHAGRAGRGRGKTPRGPRGRGTGRVGAHLQAHRYAVGQPGRRSRTPPRRMRSLTPPRTFDHWSPPQGQGRRSPRPRTDSYAIPNPYPNSHIAPVDHGGPRQADRHHPPASPGASVSRHDPKYPFAYRRQIDRPRSRTPPRLHEPAPFRALTSISRRDELVLAENRDIPPYVQPNAASAHDLSPSSGPPSPPLARNAPFGGRDGNRPIPPRFAPPYRPYPANRRTVSASSARPHTNEMQSAVHPHAQPSTHVYAPPPLPSAQPSQTLADRLSYDRGIFGAGPTSEAGAGGFQVQPRHGNGNQLRGRAVPRGGAVGRTKLVARLSDAQSSSDSLLKRVG